MESENTTSANKPSGFPPHEPLGAWMENSTTCETETKDETIRRLEQQLAAEREKVAELHMTIGVKGIKGEPSAVEMVKELYAECDQLRSELSTEQRKAEICCCAGTSEGEKMSDQPTTGERWTHSWLGQPVDPSPLTP